MEEPWARQLNTASGEFLCEWRFNVREATVHRMQWCTEDICAKASFSPWGTVHCVRSFQSFLAQEQRITLSRILLPICSLRRQAYSDLRPLRMAFCKTGDSRFLEALLHYFSAVSLHTLSCTWQLLCTDHRQYTACRNQCSWREGKKRGVCLNNPNPSGQVRQAFDIFLWRHSFCHCYLRASIR